MFHHVVNYLSLLLKGEVMKKFLVLTAVLVFVVAIGCAKKGGATAATVNGKVITTQDLDDEIESLPSQYKMFAQSPDMKKKILDNLVISELLIQEAQKEGILDKPDVQKKIADYEASIKQEVDTQIASLQRQKDKAADIAKRETVIKELLSTKDFKDQPVTDAEIKLSYAQYVTSMKKQDPKAKVDPLDKIKEDIRTSLARQKWLDSLKAKATISINDSAFASAAPAGIPAMQPQAAGAQPETVQVSAPKPAAAAAAVKK
jgi:hypothetical protein